ncbi:MAG: V-type ATP synthase subunit F [Oscillospiraceae bacterium]|nr:V-type ATP synthase subunit F [Oscillospiraceae bacterium]
MKFFLISDNIDTQMGMRIAGIEGVVAHSKEHVTEELNKAAEDTDIAVVLMTEKLVELCRDKVYDIKLNRRRPLIVEIPDRHGNSNVIDSISHYVEEAIGIKL